MHRRTFLGGLAASTLPAFGAPALARPAKFHLDALCYNMAELTSAPVEAALAGGLNAAVLDLFAFPREHDVAAKEMENWSARFADPAMKVKLVRRAADFDAAVAERKLGIVLACQDASILGSGGANFEKRLNTFHEQGLRVLQLTHNNRTSFADSYMEKRDGGLSLAGGRLVDLMNKLGMVIDLSHCSRQTLLDAVQASAKPCAVTHAGCKALAPTARNKTDEEIRALGKAGGFFGVYNMTTWLTDKPTASIDTVLNHIDHAVQLIGADQVGFGSDGALDRLDAAQETQNMARVQQFNAGGPSAEWPVRHVRIPALNAPDRMSRLADALATRRYTDAQVAGIVGGNFRRLFEKVCG
jgi:membrane dipeptidase